MRKSLLLFLLSTMPLVNVMAEEWRDPESKIIYVYSPEGTTAIVKAGTKYSTPQSYAIMSNVITIPGTINIDGKAYEVTEIGQYAFNSFIMTKEVYLPETLKKIGECAFQNCAVEDIVIPQSVEEIGESAFQQSGLRSVTLPEGLTSLPARVFSYCGKLEEIAIPQSVTAIGAAAFSDSGLKSIFIHSAIESIGLSAFIGCKSLTSITVAEDNSHYDSRDNCNALIETATNTLLKGCINTVIPSTIRIIGIGAFQSVDGLTEIQLPDGLEEIGSMAFNVCKELKNVTIPQRVKTIGMQAFYWTALESIELPAGVTSIGQLAFGKCDNVTEVKSHIVEPFAINSNTFSVYNTATLTVPDGSLEKYKATEAWSLFLNIVEDTSVGIHSVQTDKADDNAAYYSLEGRRLQQPARGVNIVHTTSGKSTKMVVK